MLARSWTDCHGDIGSMYPLESLSYKEIPVSASWTSACARVVCSMLVLFRSHLSAVEGPHPLSLSAVDVVALMPPLSTSSCQPATCFNIFPASVAVYGELAINMKV